MNSVAARGAWGAATRTDAMLAPWAGAFPARLSPSHGAACGVTTAFVPGSAFDVKVATPDDLKLAEALIALNG
ncbi:hypothetical protein [Ancylobacter vacuolatus]|uniref:2-C-methyl-D-erythritol 4-phosphate cytidylyltransferase n=1 Tax=Ancylobacter vacuolatus TaxID=223389 RepID=A0ABU0DK32_9HYPH|nr:hypothetical protein [Ancylobacter vacuolatus]MDQ0348783.1 hypothetical protein [Ancylobacter vacuolatus]